MSEQYVNLICSNCSFSSYQLIDRQSNHEVFHQEIKMKLNRG